MKIIYLYSILLICFFSSDLCGQVVFNEISNANGSTLYEEYDDENNETEDWIELYNPGSSAVNLLNYTLTDDSTDIDKWTFPNITIEPLSYKIILASGKDTLTSNFLHTNFKINPDGEKLIMSNANGNIIDQYYLGNLQNNHSVGRKPDGSSNWCLFEVPTPDGTNNNSTCYEGYETDPIFSLNAGFYMATQIIQLYTPSPTGIVRYTLDGNIPSGSANLYASPINVNETKVVSAKAYSSGNRLPSNTVKRTYFINENELGLPVFSITLDPSDLWDHNTGMYVMGPNASPAYPYFGANFWMDWEKLCHVEYFDKQKVKKFELDAGLKIHGGYSRALAQKSFRVRCRGAYGTSELDFPLIPEKPSVTSYETFNLRNAGQDYHKARFKDAFLQRVMADGHVDRMGYEPALVFLNGEYWGEYEIREKLDEKYIESNYGIPADQVDILYHRGNTLRVQAGSDAEFFTMYDYITDTDPQSVNFYNAAGQMLDLENFADYFIGETYYSNRDWIDNTSPSNNIKLWRPQSLGGKWRYMFWDLDQTSGFYGTEPSINKLAMVRNPTEPNFHSDVFRSMLYNPQFQNYFINRYADLMNVNFQHSNMQKIAYEMRDSIISSMPRHIDKWGDTYSAWFNSIDDMVDWHIQRLIYARNQIETEFNLNDQVDVTLATSPSNAGRIQISTIIPDSLPWTGVYFDGVPVTITAIPNPGFTFQYWGANGIISDPESNKAITLNISSNNTFTAHFTGSAATKFAFSEINYHSDSTSDSGDWVELHNYDNVSINLTGWNIKDSDDSNIYQVPFGTEIPPNGYIVLSNDTQKFVNQHPTVNNFIGPLPFALKNSSDQVRLFDYNNSLVLSVTYEDSPPWPKDADGKGKTLELRTPGSDPNLPLSWFAGCPGGSPGRAYEASCDTGVDEADPQPFQLQISPNPSRDFIMINIISENEGLGDMSFSMYDFIGNEVKKISPLKGNRVIVSRDEFATGVYIIKVNDGKSFLTEKIIFQ